MRGAESLSPIGAGWTALVYGDVAQRFTSARVLILQRLHGIHLTEAFEAAWRMSPPQPMQHSRDADLGTGWSLLVQTDQ